MCPRISTADEVGGIGLWVATERGSVILKEVCYGRAGQVVDCMGGKV